MATESSPDRQSALRGSRHRESSVIAIVVARLAPLAKLDVEGAPGWSGFM
jgi:hypothetical protein